MKTYNDGLRWAARWVEDSLNGETNERVIEFGKNMAMTLRAASEVQDVDRCVNEKQNSDSGEMQKTTPCLSETAIPQDISLSEFIDFTEAAHFRTPYDTGANLNALFIWNLVRRFAGKARLTMEALQLRAGLSNERMAENERLVRQLNSGGATTQPENDRQTTTEESPSPASVLESGSSPSPSVSTTWNHNRNCAIWTATTDGAKKPCDCAQADSMFKGSVSEAEDKNSGEGSREHRAVPSSESLKTSELDAAHSCVGGPPPCGFCDTGLVFTPEEIDVIVDLGKRLDLSSARVIKQALRVYQIHVLGEPELGKLTQPD